MFTHELLALQPIQVNPQEREKDEEMSSIGSPQDEGGIDLKKSSLMLVKQDKLDKREFRERIKQKHRAKRVKNKMKRKRNEVCYSTVETLRENAQHCKTYSGFHTQLISLKREQ